MKIGVYSGCFDPPHFGHHWMIEQMESLFDEVHVLLGPNYAKTPEFDEDTRLSMLNDWFHWKPKIKLKKLDAPNVVEYARLLINNIYDQSNKADFFKDPPSVFITRGIRNDIDWAYEQEIYRCMSKKTSSGGIKFMYLMSPPGRQEISSTNVKKACQMDFWDLVYDWCGRILTERLLRHYKGKDWVKHKELVSIFETTTAGFAPAGLHPVLDKQKAELEKHRDIVSSSNNHQMEMKDEKSGKDWLVCHPKVADIFDTETTGFAPVPSETFQAYPDDSLTTLQQISSGEAELLNIYSDTTPAKKLPKWTELEGSLQQIADPDAGPFDPSWNKLNDILEECFYEGAMKFQRKLTVGGLVSWTEVITKEQVESLLDPFPHKVAISEKYHLKQIPISDKVGIIGSRHLRHSRSLGPIVIDKNELPPYYQGFGKVIVIEGKHRWLDAKARGDKTILAWVGDKVLEYFDDGCNPQVLGS